MSPQLRALVWKEWRERRASLYLATAWIAGWLVYTIAYEVATGIRGPVGRFYSVCLLYGLFAPVFLAMRTALGERTQGTFGFSASLPASLRQQAAVRMLGGLVTLTAPIALGAIVLSGMLLTGAIEQSGFRPPGETNYPDFPKRPSISSMEAVARTWQSAAIAAASASEFLLILSVIGARRRSEANVGFIGAVCGFLWFLPIGLLGEYHESSSRTAVNWLGGLLPQSLVLPHSYGTPQGDYDDLEFARLIGSPLCLNLVVIASLVVWFTHRYAAAVPWASERRSRINWRLSPLVSRLALRLPGRTGAIVWLDLRQSVPLAFAGLALAFLMAVTQIWMESHSVSPSYQYGSVGVTPIVLGRLPGTTWFLATLWATVIGAGIFGAELQPGLADFWRSRPVSPSLWFWTKFTVGLIATLAVLDGTTSR